MADLPDAPDLDQIAAEDLLIVAGTYRERYAEGVAAKLRAALLALEDEASARIGIRYARLSAADRERYRTGRVASTVRIKALIEEIKRLAKRYRDVTKAHTERAAREIAPVEIDFQQEFAESRGIAAGSLTVAAVLSAVRKEPVQGRRLPVMQRQQERSVRGTVEESMADSIERGLTAEAMIAALFGFGAIKKHRDGAEGTIRTMLTHVASQAAVLSIDASEDESLYGLLFVFDKRTSTTCRAISDNPKYRVQRRGDPEAIRPPFHFRCRTVPYAIGSDRSEVRGTKASVGSSGPGQIDAGIRYSDWLKRQSRAFRLETLGRTQFEAFEAGAPLRSFADITTLKPLTAEQLKRKHARLLGNSRARRAA